MRILVTGCCGFIGTNVVERLADKHQVIGIDNLSREGTEKNLEYLRNNFIFDFRNEDITTMDILNIPDVDVVYHLAAQVGVQSSIDNPVNDLNQNIIGTFRMLEYAKRNKNRPIFIFASTNKVYGNIQANKPVSEKTPLNFHTPYGVSKGSADQYVLDYSRIYGIPSVVFRQSCIYGKHQLGKEEQGWVAWFMIANHLRLPITIYGDGNQVRDVLYIDDLVDLYEETVKNIEKMNGQAYNIGGGPSKTLSLNKLVEKANIDTDITFSDWRPADQKYYVSDISKIKKDIGWEPQIDVDTGLSLLHEHISNNTDSKA